MGKACRVSESKLVGYLTWNETQVLMTAPRDLISLPTSPCTPHSLYSKPTELHHCCCFLQLACCPPVICITFNSLLWAFPQMPCFNDTFPGNHMYIYNTIPITASPTSAYCTPNQSLNKGSHVGSHSRMLS